ncbi:LacI family DNA-binding transcriptional regulator [Desmospora profundinema]|uniref:LacI family transcriptional regulator n=1 Tax=Desmospora profundinema TaxID=1571184 RepID=A0ABU1IRN0_9BACL|nr:LacI family DNA-binding transcriptional regulator [Desmospora profundinema]MDR6227457.1 LacI family transcriptional regulator [Desmospora profundinema]
MAVTIREVAKRAGVSIATVSRVLNGSKPVSDRLKQRILEAVEETGYRPNAVARSMIQKKTGLIGVIVPEIANPYFSGLVEGIEAVANEWSYYLMLAISEKNAQRELELLRIYQSRQMDGILWAAAQMDPACRAEVEKMNIPCVVIGQRLEEVCIPSAVIDNRRASYETVKHLIQLGHQRIGMIHGPLWDVQSGKERFEGYRQALLEHGLPLRDEWTAEGLRFDVQDGVKGMESIWNQPERPTALFCACDRMAVGAMTYLKERGVSIPEELSVAGFDDEELASLVTPRLTTVRHSPYQMGYESARILTDILRRKRKSTSLTLTLDYQVVIRDSTATCKELSQHWNK